MNKEQIISHLDALLRKYEKASHKFKINLPVIKSMITAIEDFDKLDPSPAEFEDFIKKKHN